MSHSWAPSYRHCPKPACMTRCAPKRPAGRPAEASQMLPHLAVDFKPQTLCHSHFGAILKKRRHRANPQKNFLTIPESISRVFGLRTILRFDIVHFNETRFHCKNSVRGRAEWQADEHRLESTERSFSCVRDRVLMGLRTARPAAMPGGLLFFPAVSFSDRCFSDGCFSDGNESRESCYSWEVATFGNVATVGKAPSSRGAPHRSPS